MEKNQEFIVTIEDMNEDGAGVGKVDGYIWFVKDAVIGAGKGHEDKEIIWICQAHGSSGTVSLPCHSVMSGSKAMWWLSASGHEL